MDIGYKCGHCGNEGCAKLIGKFKYTAGYDEYYTSWTEWNVYFCPVCGNVSLEQDYLFSEDVHTDENGETVGNNKIEWLYPMYGNLTIPDMSKNLPKELEDDYEEARNVAGVSSKGAAALLRLLLEKLCRKYFPKSNRQNLNDMIGKLVTEGVPDYIQKACDIVRIKGNENVHAGTIDENDTAETVVYLFELINLVTDYLYMDCKRIDEMYSEIAPEKIGAIKRRDEKIRE